MENYKPNSHKFKQEQQDVSEEKARAEKVVTGTVKTKKKSGIHKLTDIFIPGDVANVKSYVFMDILVPAIKKAVSDIVTDGVDMILYGEKKRSVKNTLASKVSYRNFYDRRDDDRIPRTSSYAKPAYSYDDIILETRGEAEDVLTRMGELLDTYQVVRVADLFDLVGVTGNHTDNRYGWMNLASASVERVREGYLLNLPKAVPID